MNFKKDYLNYIIYHVMSDNGTYIRDKIVLKKVFEKIIVADDLAKITYFIGKTTGLDILFKYFLYISDKIDKSQITIFNLKENIDYDINNLKKICDKITIDTQLTGKIVKSVKLPEDNLVLDKDILDEVRIDDLITSEETEKELSDKKENQELEVVHSEDNEQEESGDKGGLTLIENKQTDAGEEELFEVADIEDNVHAEFQEDETAEPDEQDEYEQPVDDGQIIVDFSEENEMLTKENVNDVSMINENVEQIPDNLVEKSETEEKEFEITVRKREDEPEYNNVEQDDRVIKDESVTSEAYYRFENKFFEEVKILEKLFQNIEREVRLRSLNKINDKSLSSFTEIIEISSELSHLSRQLPFDIPANVFFTINLFFTKALKTPQIVTFQRMQLLSDALLLVTSLIKGKSENYLNDDIFKQIESLREDLLSRQQIYEDYENEIPVQKSKDDIQEDLFVKKTHPMERLGKKKEYITELFSSETSSKAEQYKSQKHSESAKSADVEKVNIEMKLYIRYFEKTYNDILQLQGEYSKFDALDKIDELNQYLIHIAKLSASVKYEDITRLSEVSYVFLKYLKDYRLDITTDVEAQRNISYIIFTYKMLLTNRKPEDFNIVVEYLNNPEKIFADN